MSTAVDKGVKLLDSKMPGWYRRIDLDRLDISSPFNCVLGQLDPEGCHTVTADSLGIRYMGIGNYGFDATIGDTDLKETHRRLTEEWKDVITDRLLMDEAEAIVSDSFARELVTV